MKTTTLLMTVGMGVVAAAAFGAPALAATTTAPAAPATTQAARHWDDGDDVVGYFDRRWDCERVGRMGERRDRWEDYDCTRVRWGSHRGDWALEVQRDDGDGSWYDGGSWHHGGHGHDGGSGPYGR